MLYKVSWKGKYASGWKKTIDGLKNGDYVTKK